MAVECPNMQGKPLILLCYDAKFQVLLSWSGQGTKQLTPWLSSAGNQKAFGYKPNFCCTPQITYYYLLLWMTAVYVLLVVQSRVPCFASKGKVFDKQCATRDEVSMSKEARQNTFLVFKLGESNLLLCMTAVVL